tara:strand:+ start:14705 stop:15490 length:786 start_codon:yes stop_codon:yes gene_type:complete
MAPALERCVSEFRETVTRGVFPSPECLKFGISKGLSLGIVAGAVLVKVPQIMKIVSNKSVKGLQVNMFRSEVLSGTVAIAYFARSGIAVAAYAELFFILMQNLVILGLIAGYGVQSSTSSKPKKNESFVKIAFMESAPSALVYGLLVTALFLGDTLISSNLLETLYNCTTAVLICGRAPQIYQNHVEKSTGELSFVSQLLMSAGSAARIFTTAQEGGGNSMLLAYGISASMNLCIFVQMLVFSQGKTGITKRVKRSKRKTN